MSQIPKMSHLNMPSAKKKEFSKSPGSTASRKIAGVLLFCAGSRTILPLASNEAALKFRLRGMNLTRRKMREEFEGYLTPPEPRLRPR